MFFVQIPITHIEKVQQKLLLAVKTGMIKRFEIKHNIV